MNKMLIRFRIRKNPLYIGVRKAAGQLLWLWGRNRTAETEDMSLDAALQLLQSKRPRPERIQQSPRTDYPDTGTDLSVIVPVYNMEAYVEACIRSVLDQKTTYAVELILINDGSKDGSRRTLEKYASHPGVLVVHKENGGLSSARNEGLKRASGKYVMFLDSDDLLVNNCIQPLLDKAYGEDCDIVQMQYAHLAGNTRLPSGYRWRFSTSQSYEEKCTIPGHACMKIFKSRLFSGLFFPEGYLFEDTIVHMILFDRCRTLGTIPQTGYLYRVNAGGITQTKHKSFKCLDACWIVEQVLQQRKLLGMPMTQGVYLEVMAHLSALLNHRIKSVDEQTRRAAFVLSCRMVEEAKAQMNEADISGKYRYLQRAFLERNYGLWKLYCRCNKLL